MKTAPFTTKRLAISGQSAILVASVTLLLAWPGATYGDGIGAVIFANRWLEVGRAPLFAPIYGPQAGFESTPLRGQAATNGGTVVYTGPLLAGNGYTAALFYGPEGTTDEGELMMSCSSVFRTNATLQGIIATIARPPESVCLLPGYSATNVTCQVRAWDNKGGTILTWEAVLADNRVARGSSDLMVVRAGNVTSPFEFPGALDRLTSFCLYLPDGSAVIIAQPQDRLVPPGVTANFSVGLAGTNGSETLQWQFNGTDIPGATSPSLAIPNVGYTDAGRYSVILMNGVNSQSSRVVRLTVLPTISNIEHAVIDPFGVDVVRLTYKSSPNTTIHVEAKTAPPGLTWEEISAATSPTISNYFYDIFATNLSRIYRLRQD